MHAIMIIPARDSGHLGDNLRTHIVSRSPRSPAPAGLHRPPHGIISCSVLAILLLLVLLALMAPHNIADTGGNNGAGRYTTLALLQEPVSPGDRNISLEIRFFNGTEPVDAHGIFVTLGGNLSQRQVDVDVDAPGVRTGTGRYRVEIPLTLDDTDPLTGLIPVIVRCTIAEGQGEETEDSARLLLPGRGGLTVSAVTTTPRFMPGDTVNFSVTVLRDGIPFEPDTIRGYLCVAGALPDGNTTVPLQGPGKAAGNGTGKGDVGGTGNGDVGGTGKGEGNATDTGKYWYEYHDTDDGTGRDLLFVVEATLGNHTFTAHARAVSVVADLWIRTDTVTDDTITGVFGVAGPDGAPLEAAIRYNYTVILNATSHRLMTGLTTTDGSGLAPFTLNISGMDLRIRGIPLDIRMEVTGGVGTPAGTVQSIRSILPRESRSPHPAGEFQMIHQQDRPLMPDGCDLNLTLRGYLGDEPLADSEILYFALYQPLPWYHPPDGETSGRDGEADGDPGDAGYRGYDEGRGYDDYDMYGTSHLPYYTLPEGYLPYYCPRGPWGSGVQDPGPGSFLPCPTSPNCPLLSHGLGDQPHSPVLPGYAGVRGSWSLVNASFMASGLASTSGDGTLSLTLPSPGVPAFLTILFKYQGGTGRSDGDGWSGYLVQGIPVGYPVIPGPDTGIGVANLSMGGTAEITVADPPHDPARGWGWVSLLPLPGDTTIHEVREAILSPPVTGWHLLTPPAPLGPDSRRDGSPAPLRGSLAIPGFLPGDSLFLVLVDSYDPGSIDRPFQRDAVLVDGSGTMSRPFDTILSMTVDLVDSIRAGEYKPIIVTLTGDTNLSGILVTLETTPNLKTCTSRKTTDCSGTVTCGLQTTIMDGANQTGTIWINASREGAIPIFFSKTIAINTHVALKRMAITTDLPDVIDSGVYRPMTFTVTSEGEPVKGVRVTIEAVGGANTCKVAGTTNDEGKIYCTLMTHTVISGTRWVTLYLNGTRAGFEPFRYTQVMEVKAKTAPDNITDPVSLDLPEGYRATVVASIVGNVSLSLSEAEVPGDPDPKALGVYADLQSSGVGSFRWINLTIAYDSLPQGVTPGKVRMFYWDTFLNGWRLTMHSGINERYGYVYGNGTHLGVYALMELEDTTPPVIDHRQVKRSDPGKNITISARITDEGSGVRIATLYYRTPGKTVYSIVTMVAEGNMYRGVIPARDVKLGEIIEYYIRASDGMNAATTPADTDRPYRIEVKEEEGPGFLQRPADLAAVVVLVLGIMAFLAFLGGRKKP